MLKVTLAVLCAGVILVAGCGRPPETTSGQAAPGQAAAPGEPAAQAQGVALPPGRYNCHGVSDNGSYAVLRRVEIRGAGDYVLFTENDAEQLPGAYSYDGAGAVRWLSGPLNGSAAQYGPDGMTSSPRLLIQHESRAFSCYLSGG